MPERKVFAAYLCACGSKRPAPKTPIRSGSSQDDRRVRHCIRGFVHPADAIQSPRCWWPI